MERIAVVTGANRGLGYQTSLELARKGMRVILTARDAQKAERASHSLVKEGLKAESRALDVGSSESIAAFTTWLDDTHGRVDVLVNNAGIFPKSEPPAGESGELRETGRFATPVEVLRQTLETNTLGPFELCSRIIPLMLRRKYGRVVNVSSGMGQLSEMGGGSPAYRISKTALNAVTKYFSVETRRTGILVNSVCPGWVRTDMGGPGAHRSVEEGADTIVWLATLEDNGPTGGFFRDRKPIPW